MSGGEVIGELVQETLTANALEPGQGGAVGGGQPDIGTACLNCGTALIGKHCHSCGQVAQVHRTLGSFFHDLLHGVFHFEGKIWRTLPMLAWQPGRLTREYVDGRRASYVSPIALFLFCVFLMFAVVKVTAGHGEGLADIEVNANTEAAVPKLKAQIASLERQRAKAIAEGRDTGTLDGEIEADRQVLATLDGLSEDGIKSNMASSDIPAIDHALKAFAANPRLTLYKLQSNAYKFSWALIPISALFVWLLFPLNRRFGLYDHAVFVTYSLCFMMLAVALLSLADAAGIGMVSLAAMVLPPWHMYRQLRGTYALSRGAALWRTAALLVFALLALFLFALLVLAQSG